jgi:hypothetical protein
MRRDLIPIARRLAVTAALVAATARELAWPEQGSGALLASGGVGGLLAFGLLRRAGKPRRQRAAISCTLPVDPTEALT